MQQKQRVPWAALLLGLSFAGAAAAAEREKQIFGWVEWVEFGDPHLQLKAKLDTGATTSSMNAQDVQEFERDGAAWVSFYAKHPDSDERVRFEREVVRKVRIRNHRGRPQSRPVVKMGMCLGGIYRERQMTLADRSGFVYQVLVGRNFLRGYAVVDSSETFTQEPQCKETRLAEDDAPEEHDEDDME